MLANLAVQFGVQTFIYSSAMRFGPKYEDDLKLSNRAKSNIERYCMDLSMPWMWVLLHLDESESADSSVT